MLDTLKSRYHRSAPLGIAFVGNTKNFSYPISKIIKTEMTSNGILIQKENTVNPQIVALDEYELPLSILSLLMNE